MSERGPERRSEKPSFSPVATVVFAGIAAATVTVAASSVMKHAHQNASGFSEVQGRVDNAPVVRSQPEVQNAKQAPAVQKQIGEVSGRAFEALFDSFKQVRDADGGSRVSEGENYGRNGGVKSATDRNSARVGDAFVKNGTASRLSDNSLSGVDRVLAHIGDLKSISSLKGDRLSAVVEEAVRVVGGHADDVSIFHGVRKAAIKLNPISAKKHSELLNGLKMVMKEGVHYKAYDNNTVDLLPLGVTLIDRMKLDIGTEQLATLIGENLDAFRLGGKETEVRGLIRGEIGKVFEGRGKRRDAVRSRERNGLAKDDELNVSDAEVGLVSYADAEFEDAALAQRDAIAVEETEKMKLDQSAYDEGYVDWIDGLNGDGFDDENVARAGGEMSDVEFGALFEEHFAQNGVTSEALEKGMVSDAGVEEGEPKSDDVQIAEA